MPEIVLLISCMHQHDHSILDRSNVMSNAIVINQCDHESVEHISFINRYGQKKWCKFISTTQRGLSRSRNMAIANAPEDAICLICDDDETFDDHIEEKIKAGYERMPQATLIAFSLKRDDLTLPKIYPADDRPLRFRQLLSTSSLQITFRKKKLTDSASLLTKKWAVAPAMEVAKKTNSCLI